MRDCGLHCCFLHKRNPTAQTKKWRQKANTHSIQKKTAFRIKDTSLSRLLCLAALTASIRFVFFAFIRFYGECLYLIMFSRVPKTAGAFWSSIKDYKTHRNVRSYIFTIEKTKGGRLCQHIHLQHKGLSNPASVNIEELCVYMAERTGIALFCLPL